MSFFFEKSLQFFQRNHFDSQNGSERMDKYNLYINGND